MGRIRHAVLAVTAVIALASSGCGDKKKTEEAFDPAKPECAANSDCEKGWTCLAGECVDPTLRGVATGNAVTPEKVKKHVEEIGKKADERGQTAIDL